MATEQELNKCKIELNSYKLNSDNIPVEQKPPENSEDSLLTKARGRWAGLNNTAVQETTQSRYVSNQESPRIIKQTEMHHFRKWKVTHYCCA